VVPPIVGVYIGSVTYTSTVGGSVVLYSCNEPVLCIFVCVSIMNLVHGNLCSVCWPIIVFVLLEIYVYSLDY